MEELYCHECGQEFIISESGIATHVDEQGFIDHDADADHVPFTREQVARLEEIVKLVN